MIWCDGIMNHHTILSDSFELPNDTISKPHSDAHTTPLTHPQCVQCYHPMHHIPRVTPTTRYALCALWHSTTMHCGRIHILRSTTANTMHTHPPHSTHIGPDTHRVCSVSTPTTRTHQGQLHPTILCAHVPQGVPVMRAIWLEVCPSVG